MFSWFNFLEKGNKMFFIGILGVNNRSKVKKDIYFKCTGCIGIKGELIENYSSFEVFFIPVYKFNKKYFLRCKKCESLYWLKEEHIPKILETKQASYEDIKEIIYQKETCPKCGKEINKKYEYCPNCGEKL